MKKAEQIKKRMDELIVEIHKSFKEEDDKQYKKRKKRLKKNYDWLKVCYLYLSTNPTLLFFRTRKSKIS